MHATLLGEFPTFKYFAFYSNIKKKKPSLSAYQILYQIESVHMKWNDVNYNFQDKINPYCGYR